MVDRVAKHFGTLTLVVNNAGINRRKSSVLASMDVWRSVMETNLLAAMNLTRACLPYLIRHAVVASGVPSPTNPALVFINTNYANPRQQVLPGIAPVQ